MKEKNTRKFNLYETYGEWKNGVTAGGTNTFERNPQHNFTISNKRDKAEECSVVITLMQKLSKRKKEHSIGFRLYKRNEEQSEEALSPNFINNAVNVTATSGAYINLREVSKTFNLPEGSYCLIPSTYESGQEAEYLVRIYVDDRWNCNTEGKRFTVRDHKCCFTCCCPWGFSCKNACASSCCKPNCDCHPKPKTKPACKNCCSTDCCKTKCCQGNDYYRKASEDESDTGKVRQIKIHLVENTGKKERKRDKLLSKIGEKYPKAMDKMANFKDFYHWNDSSTSEIRLLRRITNILDNDS